MGYVVGRRLGVGDTVDPRERGFEMCRRRGTG